MGYFGYIMRSENDAVLQLIMQGKFDEKEDLDDEGHHG